MGLLSGLFGMASAVDADAIEKQLQKIFAPDEQVQQAYQFVRDTIIFTDRRLIFVDYQGVTGKKTEYLSIPYRSISSFSVQTTGHFDIDAELFIWVVGRPDPVRKEFSNDKNVHEIQRALAQFAMR